MRLRSQDLRVHDDLAPLPGLAFPVAALLGRSQDEARGPFPAIRRGFPFTHWSKCDDNLGLGPGSHVPVDGVKRRCGGV